MKTLLLFNQDKAKQEQYRKKESRRDQKMSRAFPDGFGHVRRISKQNDPESNLQLDCFVLSRFLNIIMSLCVCVCVNKDLIIIQPRQSRSKNNIEKRENVTRFPRWLVCVCEREREREGMTLQKLNQRQSRRYRKTKAKENKMTRTAPMTYASFTAPMT